MAEIGGITPPNAIEIRWMPADGGAQTLVASAQGGRGLQFVGTDSSRVYFTTNRGLQSITLDGLDRRTLLRVQGVGPGNNPPSADDIVLAPDGRRAFVNLQNKHYLVDVPRAGRETVEVRIQGRAENTAVPVKRMSLEGGEYPAWTRDGRTVTWSWGAQFFRQAVDAAEPQKTDVVVEVPRARPSGSILLSGARVITMIGDQVIESGDVLVTDNRIVAVGERGRVAAPAGVRRLDLRGKTVMPGFVDVHAHMWAPRGLHQTAIWQYYANLAYGVTTTRDPQTSTPDVFAYADMVDAGMMPGPRVFATGPGVFSSSGIEDRDAAFRFLKRYKEAYRTNTIKQYVAGDRLVRQWIIEASHAYGITPTIEGSLDLKLNLTQIADGYTGQEHSFPIMPLHKDVVEFVARTKTFYTPTILVAYGAPWSENHWFETENTVGDAKLNRWIPNELLDTMIRRRPQWFVPEEYGHTKLGKQVADIVHAGGRAGLGSHGQLQGLGAHWETWNLGSGGLTPHETLKVITTFGAEALGLQQDVGSLEAGKLADLVVLDANPLVNLRNTNTLRYVMKNGELFEADTLNAVWPVAKTLPQAVLVGHRPAESCPGADRDAGRAGGEAARRACRALTQHHAQYRSCPGRPTPRPNRARHTCTTRYRNRAPAGFDVGQHRQELGEDHRRGAPDACAVDGEVRHVHHHLGWMLAAALLPLHGIGIAQERQRRLDQALDLGLGDEEVRACGGHANHRVQQVARHRHVERRQPADDLDRARRETYFLVGLAQGRGLDRLARIDPPTRQRDLAGVMPQSGAAQGQR